MPSAAEPDGRTVRFRYKLSGFDAKHASRLRAALGFTHATARRTCEFPGPEDICRTRPRYAAAAPRDAWAHPIAKARAIRLGNAPSPSESCGISERGTSALRPTPEACGNQPRL